VLTSNWIPPVALRVKVAVFPVQLAGQVKTNQSSVPAGKVVPDRRAPWPQLKLPKLTAVLNALLIPSDISGGPNRAPTPKSPVIVKLHVLPPAVQAPPQPRNTD